LLTVPAEAQLCSNLATACAACETCIDQSAATACACHRPVCSACLRCPAHVDLDDECDHHFVLEASGRREVLP